MTRIVYSFAGDGSGHSSRAREMIRHLLERGHDVRPVSYGRGFENLRDEFDVFPIEGLFITNVNNKVSLFRTLTDNLGRLPDGAKRYRALKSKVFDDFQPEVAISDFEPMVAYVARNEDIPLISLDNQHRLRYMRYPCPRELKPAARLAVTVIRAMIPSPDASLVTTFYYGEVRNPRCFLFPPLIRESVIKLQAEESDHIIVYFTGRFDAYLEQLKAYPRERFLIYGQRDEGEEGNLIFRPFSGEGFLSDFARCKAVIATAGFTLMTEAIYLGKPTLALPMEGQFEQEFNALLLEEAGLGKNGRRRTQETIGEFLYRLPEYRENLMRTQSQTGGVRDDHSLALKQKLDELVDHGAEGAREFQSRRLEGQ